MKCLNRIIKINEIINCCYPLFMKVPGDIRVIYNVETHSLLHSSVTSTNVPFVTTGVCECKTKYV